MFDLENTWLDFMQIYDYDDKNNYCTYSLYSTSLEPISIRKNGSSLKKKWFCEFEKHFLFY